MVILRPRNIPKFEEAISKIKCDKLHINYYAQYLAYQLARFEFLKRSEYTHFVLVTDDLIVTPRDFEILKGDAEKYDVISGWANNWLYGPWAEYSSVSFSLPLKQPAGGTMEDYHFATILALEVMKEANPNNPIIPVLHQGTMCTFLKREIVEKIPFRTDLNCCVDAMLSHDLYNAGIKQYVDLRVRMLHLKTADEPQGQGLLVDKLPPSVVYEPQ